MLGAVPTVTSWFEQPCETLDQIAHVRSHVLHALGVDESVHTFHDVARVGQEGIAEVVNIKINRVGGLTKARRMRDIALAHGIQLYVMATGGSVLADTEAAHMAQSIPREFRLGTWSCQDMLTEDVAPGRGARNVNGKLTVDEAPGLGFAPDEDRLGEPVAVYEA